MRLRALVFRVVAALATVFLLARCHGVGSSMPPILGSNAASTMGNATFSVSPAAGVQSMVVTLAQVNGGAAPKTAPFSMNLTAATKGCTATGGSIACTATFPAPIGNDTFNITTYSGQNGTGTTVSTTQATAAIVAGTKANCVQVTPGPAASTHGASI